MVLFDNLFYRMTRLFFKHDVKEGFSAIIYLTVVQGFGAIFCFFAVRRALTGTARIDHGLHRFELWVLVAVLLLMYANYRRYHNAYERLHHRWGEETEAPGFLRGLGALLLFLSPFTAMAYFL